MRTANLVIERPSNHGIQRLYRFENGFGASVVRSPLSYGGARGLWELAVIDWDDDGKWDITYNTPVTNDVVGYLTPAGVDELLVEIEALPAY